MKTEIVDPNLSNFIKSLRDVGYTFEIAVADIIDNSIAAKATSIKIYTVADPAMVFAILDNGTGMSDGQLREAMRLATRNPDEEREKSDLGRFGLGLKTASFSQCRKLTVISRRDGKTVARQWDLDVISRENKWLLVTPTLNEIQKLPLFNELSALKHGTLVLWEKMDRYRSETFTSEIPKLRRHLALVFHRFLEGAASFKSLKLELNNNPIKPFNPFNVAHPATQQGSPEKIKRIDSTIIVQPFILPHHSKLSQQEYEQYATDEGYTKSQGFYLYRSNRLLIYGTWWGLHRTIDAHKLVRVKIDISNDQDHLWGIDIKKSTARPAAGIKADLARIIQQVTERGSRPFTGRGRRIENRAVTRFWELVPFNDSIRFVVNLQHPLLVTLLGSCGDNELLSTYLKGLQAYLPLDAIQANLQQHPHKIDQAGALTDDEINSLAARLLTSGLDPEYIQSLLKTEIFKNREDLFAND